MNEPPVLLGKHAQLHQKVAVVAAPRQQQRIEVKHVLLGSLTESVEVNQHAERVRRLAVEPGGCSRSEQSLAVFGEPGKDVIFGQRPPVSFHQFPCQFAPLSTQLSPRLEGYRWQEGTAAEDVCRREPRISTTECRGIAFDAVARRARRRPCDVTRFCDALCLSRDWHDTFIGILVHHE
eukprot:97207-Prymnesium_polylepis.1